MRIAKMNNLTLIWTGSVSEYEVRNFTPIDISLFSFLRIDLASDESCLIPITGVGQYRGSLITYLNDYFYLKAFFISIVNDHFYVSYAREQVINKNSLIANQPFTIKAIYGIY